MRRRPHQSSLCCGDAVSRGRERERGKWEAAVTFQAVKSPRWFTQLCVCDKLRSWLPLCRISIQSEYPMWCAETSPRRARTARGLHSRRGRRASFCIPPASVHRLIIVLEHSDFSSDKKKQMCNFTWQYRYIITLLTFLRKSFERTNHTGMFFFFLVNPAY